MNSVSQSTLDVRDSLIERHRSYVRALAVDIVKNLPASIELDELVACGDLGLIEAAERYDARRGVSFQTFAYYRIRGAIYDGLRKMGYLSRAEHTRSRFAAHANDLLEARAGDDHAGATAASGATTARSRSIDDEIEEAQAIIGDLIPIYILSLDAEQSREIADRKAHALENIEQEELFSLTRALVAELPADDRQFIEDVYFRELTATAAGAKLGASRSWSSRLHTRAIKHLRELMEERGLLNSNDGEK